MADIPSPILGVGFVDFRVRRIRESSREKQAALALQAIRICLTYSENEVISYLPYHMPVLRALKLKLIGPEEHYLGKTRPHCT